MAQQTRVKQGKLEEGTIIFDKAIEAYDTSPVVNQAAIAYLQYELGVTYHRLKVRNSFLSFSLICFCKKMLL